MRRRNPPEPPPRIRVRNNVTETPNTAGAIDLFRRILLAVEEEERERNGIPGPVPKKLNIDIDAILATLQVPAVADAEFIGYAALYIRVSTTDQGERYSLPTQLRQLLLKAARDGCRVKREHIFIYAYRQTGGEARLRFNCERSSSAAS